MKRLLPAGLGASGIRTMWALGALGALKAVALVALAEAVARGIVGVIDQTDAWRDALILGAAAALLRGGVVWMTGVVAARAAIGTKERLRHDLAERAMAGGVGPVGSLVALATRGLDDLDHYFSRVLPAVATAAAVPLLIGARILFADWVSAVVIVVTVPLIPVFMALIGMQTAERVTAASAALARLSDHLVELARGLPVLVGLGRVDEQSAALDKISRDYRIRTMATLRTAFMSSLALELIATISVAVVAVFIGFRLIDGSLPLEIGLLALILAPECYAPFRDLGAAFHAANDGVAAVNRARAVIDVPVGSGLLSKPRSVSNSRSLSSARPLSSARSLSLSKGPTPARPLSPARSLSLSKGPTPAGPLSPARSLSSSKGPSPAGPLSPARSLSLSKGPTPARPLSPARSLSSSKGPTPVQVRNLTVTRADRGLIIDGLDFDLPPHSITAIAGASGRGKSTVLAVLAGRLASADGVVVGGIVEGVDPLRVAWAPQHPVAVSPTVADELQSFGATDVAALLSRFDLTDVGASDPAQLSPGELRRLAIARVVARVECGATLVLLDEPTAHLDAEHARAVEREILAMSRAASVVLASHEARVLALADTVVWLAPPLRQAQGPYFAGAALASVAELPSGATPASVAELVEAPAPNDGPLRQAQGPQPPNAPPLRQAQGPQPPNYGPLRQAQGPQPPNYGPLRQAQGPQPPNYGPLRQAQGPQPPNNAPLRQAQGPQPPNDAPLRQAQGPYFAVEARPLRTLLRILAPTLPRLALAVALGTLAALFAVALTAVSGWLIVRASQHPAVMYLLVAIVGVRFFGIGRSVVRYAERLVTHDAVFRSIGVLRSRLWAGFAALGPGSRALAQGGRALDYLVLAADEIRDLIPRVLMPPLVALATSGAAVIAFQALAPETVPVLIGCLVLSVLVAPAVALWADRRASRAGLAVRSEMIRSLARLLAAAADLRANGVDDVVRAKVDALDRRAGHLARTGASALGLGAAIVVATGGIGAMLVLAASVAGVAGGTIAPELVAVLVLVPLALVDPLLGAVDAVQQWPTLREALRRVGELEVPQAAAGSIRMTSASTLTLDDVSARWPGADVDAVLHVSAEVARGSWLVVTGPSGSGKSTLLSVLLGHIPASNGRYLLGGVPARHILPADLRRLIAWCPQDSHLFDSTLRANLLLGRARDDSPTDAELHGALASAGLGAMLERLLNGLDTRIGSAGNALSGGERQRVAVARTLLSRADVVLLDEPTAHLDTETADELMRDLRAAFADRIVVLVTHHVGQTLPGDRVVRLGEREHSLVE